MNFTRKGEYTVLTHETLLSVASHFDLGGIPVRVKELTAGNINVTYRLDIAEDKTAPRYVLQISNEDVSITK